MKRSGKAALAGIAMFLALFLWPVSRGCLAMLRSSGPDLVEPAAAATRSRYPVEGGVLLEVRRVEAVQCRYVYPSGPRKGRRCGHVTKAPDALCPNHRATGLVTRGER